MLEDIEQLSAALDRLKSEIEQGAGSRGGAWWLIEASQVVFKLRCRAERYALNNPDDDLLAAFRKALSEPQL